MSCAAASNQICTIATDALMWTVNCQGTTSLFQSRLACSIMHRMLCDGSIRACVTDMQWSVHPLLTRQVNRHMFVHIQMYADARCRPRSCCTCHSCSARLHRHDMLSCPSLVSQVSLHFLHGPSCMHSIFHMRMLCPMPIHHQHLASTVCAHKGEWILTPQFCIAHS